MAPRVFSVFEGIHPQAESPRTVASCSTPRQSRAAGDNNQTTTRSHRHTSTQQLCSITRCTPSPPPSSSSLPPTLARRRHVLHGSCRAFRTRRLAPIPFTHKPQCRTRECLVLSDSPHIACLTRPHLRLYQQGAVGADGVPGRHAGRSAVQPRPNPPRVRAHRRRLS
jgi:hypothetical protein